jgi:hypothetical protein
LLKEFGKGATRYLQLLRGAFAKQLAGIIGKDKGAAGMVKRKLNLVVNKKRKPSVFTVVSKRDILDLLEKIIRKNRKNNGKR